MSEGHELTIKQILDSAWVRRLSRALMILLLPTITAVGSAGSWVLYENWRTSQKAVMASEAAAIIAKQALLSAEQLKAKQDDRAEVADDRADDAKLWQQRLDDGLVRLNARVSAQDTKYSEKLDAVYTKLGDVLGDIGEIKGLIIRQNASADYVAPVFPSEFLR